MVGTSAAKVSGDAAGVEAIGEKAEVAAIAEDLGPFFELVSGAVGDIIETPEASRAVQDYDGRVGSASMGLGVGFIDDSGKSKLVLVVRVTRKCREGGGGIGDGIGFKRLGEVEIDDIVGRSRYGESGRGECEKAQCGVKE